MIEVPHTTPSSRERREALRRLLEARRNALISRRVRLLLDDNCYGEAWQSVGAAIRAVDCSIAQINLLSKTRG
jgi:hypothetical protein